MTSPYPTVRRRRLAAELRRLREAGGFTCEEVAEHLECSASKISRVENARVGIIARDVKALLDLYGVPPGKLREGLLALAREVRRKGWWIQYGDVLTDTYQDYISLETSATSIRDFESQLVPGLLQTAGYTRAVAAALPHQKPEAEIEKYVEVRMARRAVLHKANPPHFWAILDEAVLRRPIGGPVVMREQILHLLEVARTPAVTLQVLPFRAGSHAGIEGPFTILGFPEPADLDVVYVEYLANGLYLESADEIALYSSVFDHLRASALSAHESLAFVAKVAVEEGY